MRQALFRYFALNPNAILEHLKGKVDYIFLAHPEQDFMIDPYWPSKDKCRIPKEPFFGGLISSSDTLKRGAIFFRPYTSVEFIKDRDSCGNTAICRQTINSLAQLTNDLQAKCFAAAGVLPKIFANKAKKGAFKIPNEFVSGELGTVYVVARAFLQAKKRLGLERPCIVVFGASGRIGAPLLNFLQSKGENVFGFDKGDNKEKLSQAQIAINLMSKGDSIFEYEGQLNNLLAVVDDTYPPQSGALKGAHLFKTVGFAPGVRFLPQMPGFAPSHLPGCAVEAMVRASLKERVNDMQKFYQEAQKLGTDAKAIMLA